MDHPRNPKYKPYKTRSGFDDKHYSVFMFLFLLKLRGVSTGRSICIYEDDEHESCFHLEQLVCNLKEDGLLTTADSFDIKKLEKHYLPHKIVVGFTVKGDREITNRICTIMGVILSIIVVILTIFS